MTTIEIKKETLLAAFSLLFECKNASAIDELVTEVLRTAFATNSSVLLYSYFNRMIEAKNTPIKNIKTHILWI